MTLLTLDTFSPYVGEVFRIHTGLGTTVDAELVEARLLDPRGQNPDGMPRRDPFALLFKGPLRTELPQRIYAIEHSACGRHDIFIVPVGPGGGGLLYEAIFS
jgi:hypothetical protein